MEISYPKWTMAFCFYQTAEDPSQNKYRKELFLYLKPVSVSVSFLPINLLTYAFTLNAF